MKIFKLNEKSGKKIVEKKFQKQQQMKCKKNEDNIRSCACAHNSNNNKNQSEKEEEKKSVDHTLRSGTKRNKL